MIRDDAVIIVYTVNLNRIQQESKYILTQAGLDWAGSFHQVVGHGDSAVRFLL